MRENKRRCVLSDKEENLLKVIDVSCGKLCKSMCGKAVFEKINDRHYLIYEINDSVYDYFRDSLKKTVAKTVLYSVKDSFYRENLPFKYDNIYAFVILKALVFADFKEVAKKLVDSFDNFDEFHIDGISNFMLKNEMTQWREIARATNENSYILTQKNEYRKFLGCIVPNVGGEESLYLLGEEEPFLVTMELNKVKYSQFDGEKMTSNQLFIANLIEHLPSKLIIYNKNLPKELACVIDLLFESNLSSQNT